MKSIKFHLINNSKFGRWQLVKIAGRDNHGKQLVTCHCECGAIKEVMYSNLLSGKSKSCGCLRKELLLQPIGQGAFGSLYSSYRSNAKKFNREFNLTKEQFHLVCQKDCYYCGCVPRANHLPTLRANGGYIHNGIDRFDNSKGYTIDNSVPCCKRCNIAKRDMDGDIFLEWIKQIYNYRVSPIGRETFTTPFGK